MMGSSVEEFLNQASFNTTDDINCLYSIELKDLVKTVKRHEDYILYGPPGTSKTYMINSLKKELEAELGLFTIVQFHAEYSYEDFIEGIVPDVETGGFRYNSGVFLDFCKNAQQEQFKDKICLFVIDEINRANVTAVLGEVMYLMEEKGKRILKTPKQNLEFIIPPNVVIGGTMNTADKSLSKLDFALRRRFRFLPSFPSARLLHLIVAKVSFNQAVGLTVEDYVNCFNILNAKITKHPLLGKNLTLGHVLWCRKNISELPYSREDVRRIFTESILPQIESYCGANSDVLGYLLGPSLRDKLLYGYLITSDDIINYLLSLKNSKVVNI